MSPNRISRPFGLPMRLGLLSTRPAGRRHITTPKDAQAQSRLHRFNDRLPSFLRAYTTPLLSAPTTHITSFLILHEITAIVPLFGLVAAFHYGGWLPDFTSYSGFDADVTRLTRWLRKKGWVGESVEIEDVTAAGTGTMETATATEAEKKGVRLVLEFATAYAATKAFLPVRIVASVWATPWFARAILGPVGKGVRRLFRR
ncbi:uncharacterized protein BDV17DRAFT_232641 [Aspergillus undulatus]|uniref:uncharacterized protein n=1 Tax=Aspergillus undulatus TaxID=1810928 RepID=UPI003CCDEF98